MKTDAYTMACGKVTKSMVRANLNGHLEANLQVSLLMIRDTVRVCLSTQMEVHTWEAGVMSTKMAKESSPGLTTVATMVNSVTI